VAVSLCSSRGQKYPFNETTQMSMKQSAGRVAQAKTLGD
jgi:hypothetical protein